ncbi:MAG: efflux RND transporter periplasmic adaptor subunit [Simplicispira suum]|uniref:efflux RND transporter periplasmic adaptor subunit n=1 Tax=Simplicispira suum TaxID=2109915 RepID=UPI001C6BD9A7|nr:efflux RND transporter periplasmic adaptor subunit [Simplicispira suum]MBW7834072.1 efflux RND transporter periplasmic adaptor subunit [Simplicispira suum]
MSRLPLQRRTLALLAVVLPLLALFIYVVLRSGPLAPVAVTVATAEQRSITPALFGIGTVEARTTYHVGPTVSGRVLRLSVQVGDRVRAGQVLGEMDAVDFDERLRAQAAAIQRAQASLKDAQARQQHAQSQATRYAELLAVRATSEEIATARQQDLASASAALAGSQAEVARLRAEQDALRTQRGQLRLRAPADALVTARLAEPGSTVVPGQAVVDLVDPGSLWVNVRFDQTSSAGLRAGLPAQVLLRSDTATPLAARVLRVEPLADAVTEETLAKAVLNALPDPLPPLGTLAEVTITLPELAAAPTIPNAALRRVGGKMGVWELDAEGLRFAPLELGQADLDGHVQVQSGLNEGARIVVYSEKELSARSNTHVVDRIVKGAP